MWDAATGQQIGGPLIGHTDQVSSVAFSPDGRRIVSGSRDKTLRVWDAASHQRISVPLTGYTGGVETVAFSPDGKRIVSGDDELLGYERERHGDPYMTTATAKELRRRT